MRIPHWNFGGFLTSLVEHQFSTHPEKNTQLLSVEAMASIKSLTEHGFELNRFLSTSSSLKGTFPLAGNGDSSSLSKYSTWSGFQTQVAPWNCASVLRLSPPAKDHHLSYMSPVRYLLTLVLSSSSFLWMVNANRSRGHACVLKTQGVHHQVLLCLRTVNWDTLDPLRGW